MELSVMKRNQGKQNGFYRSILHMPISHVGMNMAKTDTHCDFIMPLLASTDEPILPWIFDVKLHGIMLSVIPEPGPPQWNELPIVTVAAEVQGWWSTWNISLIPKWFGGMNVYMGWQYDLS
jgi:hypothetical protein